MNYHIIPQDKFFETYIEDLYRIHQEDDNVIWIRGEKGRSPFFQTTRRVEYLGDKAEVYIEHLSRITSGDKLFVSWYDSFIGSIILQADLSAPLYVYLMGGDFYSQPDWWHEKWLLDPLTKRKVRNERLFPTYLPLDKPWRWYRWLDFRKQLRKQYTEKLKTIERINYLVLPEHATGEMRLVRHLYPVCKAEHRIGTFDQNFDLSKDYPNRGNPRYGDRVRILLGNSADLTGNQMDAIRYLKRKVRFPFDVYCLLSYGDEDAKRWIRAFGEKELGGRFHPVTEYMERKQFIDFLNSIDLIMMYHNRQQAVGTIMTALALGKPVFLKYLSPLFSQLLSMGIKPIYNVEEMHQVDCLRAIHHAQEFRQDTLERIDREYSDSTRISHLMNLLG